MTQPPPPLTNSLASAALVFAFLFPPLGLALALLALDEIRERADPGRGLAVAAAVVGGGLTVVAVLLLVAALLLWVLALLLGAGVIPWY